MSPTVCHQIRHEADLIERFAGSYRRKFVSLIEQLNKSPGDVSSAQCLRLCVEAVDMLLESHNQLAQAISRMAEGENAPVRSAA